MQDEVRIVKRLLFGSKMNVLLSEVWWIIRIVERLLPEVRCLYNIACVGKDISDKL